MRVLVKAALSGLLTRLGHDVTDTRTDGHLMVLADTALTPDNSARRTQEPSCAVLAFRTAGRY
ncbi:hypothetical protein GCM10010372_51120 [Streptomyces tauricus]|uniref:hypothetical protein n=1 Tax=Streptomyces tauricus TaxID=68274 RepID=UPI001673C132|nr:hypothetical protein [Streptomyces tauricus]GHA44939.1 hypothetical protein GCM10010372_51120 [Streptomyces tauricus]